MSSTRRRRRERHVPVLRDRIVELLAPALQQPGAVVRRRHAGHGRPRRGVLDGLPGRAAGRHRPRPGGAARWPGSGSAASATASPRARGVRRDRPTVLADLGLAHGRTASCSTSASPRCSSTRPSAASPTATTRRWTCGWTSRTGITAADVLNTYSADDLTRILRDTARSGSPAGSPRPSCASAQQEPFTTSARLVELLRGAIPAASQRSGGHPAKRTFQALRIEVNGELRGLAARAARPRSTRWPSAAGSPCWPTTRSRTGMAKQLFAARRPQQHPAGPAGRAARARGLPAAAHPRRRGARARTSSDDEPPRRLGPPAGRRAHPSHEGSSTHEPARGAVDGPRRAPAGRRAGAAAAPVCGSSPRAPARRHGQLVPVRRRCASRCSSAGLVGAAAAQHRDGPGLVHAAATSRPRSGELADTQDALTSSIDRAAARRSSRQRAGRSAWCPRRARRSCGCPTARSSAWRRRRPRATALYRGHRRRRPRPATGAPAAGGDDGRRRCTQHDRPVRCTWTAPRRQPRGERVTQSRDRQGGPAPALRARQAPRTPPRARRDSRDPQRAAARARSAGAAPSSPARAPRTARRRRWLRVRARPPGPRTARGRRTPAPARPAAARTHRREPRRHGPQRHRPHRPPGRRRDRPRRRGRRRHAPGGTRRSRATRGSGTRPAAPRPSAAGAPAGSGPAPSGPARRRPPPRRVRAMFIVDPVRAQPLRRPAAADPGASTPPRWPSRPSAAALQHRGRPGPARPDRSTPDGVVLASSVERDDVVVDQQAVPAVRHTRQHGRHQRPRDTVGVAGAAATLAPLLGMTVAELTAKLTGTSRFNYLAKGITPLTSGTRSPPWASPASTAEQHAPSASTRRARRRPPWSASSAPTASPRGGLELMLQQARCTARPGTQTYEQDPRRHDHPDRPEHQHGPPSPAATCG